MVNKPFFVLVILSIITACKNDHVHNESTDIKFIDPQNISIRDEFWTPILERNRLVTIPHSFYQCELTGRINNFAVAGGLSSGEFTGERYNDTDVYKTIEGAANSLINHPDSILEAYVDSLIGIIAAAQEDDGYLFTARTASPTEPAPGSGREKWIDIWVSHELYDAGHLYEAAVAYYQATDKKNLLDVAVKNADLVCDEFGWGKREAAPGHQEIELGLIKLYEVTGDEKYLDQARFFLDVRGTPQDFVIHPEGTRFAIYNNKIYLQQHIPILEQSEAVGHAVRATYMYTAMTDIARHLGSNEYLEKSQELWEDVVTRKLYLTGGVGAVGEGESFGEAFYLPNKEAYNETCAAIGNILWNQSLFWSTGFSKFYDVLELTLYNGFLSAISQDGNNFFYPNPLASEGNYTRSPWFGVACCPGNVCRLIPSVPRMIYAFTFNSVYVNLFIGSEVRIPLMDSDIILRQSTGYPWDGRVELTLEPEKPTKFALYIRIPSWLGNSPVYGDLYSYIDSIENNVDLTLNSKQIDYEIINGYAVIERKWKTDDKVNIQFPMPVRRVISHEKVEANTGRMAVERGPFVYCLEEVDNGKVLNLQLNPDFRTEYTFDPDLLGGTGKIQLSDTKHSLTAIPYFLWANRESGEMEVWFKVLPY